MHNILHVPFEGPDTVDRVVWAFSKFSNFTVHSCYHNLISGKMTMEDSSSSINGFNIFSMGLDLGVESPSPGLYILVACLS